MEQVEFNTAETAAAGSATTGKPVMYGEPVYNEIVHFLIEEAHLLDSGLFRQWIDLLAEDVVVSMPVRQTLSRRRGDDRGELYWLFDDKEALTFKALRYLGDGAWADDPPSRIRRMITNVRVHETSVAGEYLAQSYLQLQRNSGNSHTFSTFSARRDDILRQTPAGWQIAKRDLLVDHAVGAPLSFVL